jgi:hypothetical protein
LLSPLRRELHHTTARHVTRILVHRVRDKD